MFDDTLTPFDMFDIRRNLVCTVFWVWQTYLVGSQILGSNPKIGKSNFSYQFRNNDYFNISIVVITPHAPVYFRPNRHSFGDIELKFCFFIVTCVPVIIHQI